VGAICEAVTRPTMRFVAVKSPEQQSAMMLHRVTLLRSGSMPKSAGSAPGGAAQATAGVVH
jgi:hypothetical protein